MTAEEIPELLRAIRQGDTSAFGTLVTLYEKKIYNLALHYVKQSEEAKDLAQDIFVTVYKSIDTLRDENKFTTWLYQVAVNHCRNRYKKLRRRGFFTNQSIDDPDSFLQLASADEPAGQFEREDVIKMVRAAIASMPETEKEILVLRDIQEMSYEEISDILGIPLGTVKSKLNRARTALKNKLKKFI
jgi:RNA polymerase sigma-70 factor (ECF subfamily)